MRLYWLRVAFALTPLFGLGALGLPKPEAEIAEEPPPPANNKYFRTFQCPQR